MSMDLEVWSELEFDLNSWLPAEEGWEQSGDEWSCEGEGWQVLVNRDQAEERPASVTGVLPGANYIAYITLEPIGADPKGYAFLEEIVRRLARNGQGVWVDPSGEAFGPDEGSFS